MILGDILQNDASGQKKADLWKNTQTFRVQETGS